MNLEYQIAKKLGVNQALIQKTPKVEMGDYCLPCFVFAKEKKVPITNIIEEFKNKIKDDKMFSKSEQVGGYLNLFLNKQYVGEKILNDNTISVINKSGKNKVVCIDYCSVNLAKYLHIGHFTTTIIGESLARIYEAFGYKVVRINYVGDYGTPFGKMVVAFKLWGDKNDIENRGMDAIQDLYVKFCANENDELLEKARFASYQIENKIGEEYQIYKWIINITIDETKKLVGKMGISFDDWRGESTYNDKMEKPLEEINKMGLSKVENGALIIDMNKFGLGVCVLKRSDGGSLYITRDLSAVEDRYNLYHFDEMLYVTATQQNSHFAKLFKICELLNKPYAKKLKHIGYGMFSLPEGKIASRKGKQALFQDILNEAEEQAFNVVKDRNIKENKKKEIAKNVAISAIAFSILKVERIKDKIFDINKAVSFDGETGPYIQYTYARINSLIKKYKKQYKLQKSELPEIDDKMFEILKLLTNYKSTIYQAKKSYEPSIISRYILELCKQFNTYYNETKIITENERESAGKINFVIAVKKVLEKCMKLVCVSKIEEM